MRVPAINRITLFALVGLALVALVGVAWFSRPVTVSAGQQPPSSGAAAVSVGARACPSPGAPGSRGMGIAMIAAAAGTEPGQASVSRLSATGGTGGGPSLVTRSQPGKLTLSGVSAVPASHTARSAGKPKGTKTPAKGGTTPAKSASAPVGQQGGVMIQAHGSMAQGLDVEQTSGGLATASCASPDTDFWFTGPGQESAASIQLYLMDVDNQPSSVDVDIATDTGALQGSTDTGITVPPHGLVVQSLAGLVHGSRSVEMHVRTSIGRVVAAVRESSRAGQDGQWLPASQTPAEQLVVPGLPATSGTRQLYVAAPGTGDAQVKLTVVSTGGSYQPTGAAGIDIPAGSVSRIELPSLGGVAGAIVLSSNVPVVAAVMLPGGQKGAPGAFTAAEPAIEEQGVVAYGGGQVGDATTLVLTAPGKAAQVRISSAASAATGAASGRAGDQRLVSIPAKRSVTVKIGRPAGSASGSGFALVLTPLHGSGPVYAGRVLAGKGGTVLSVIPVASAPTSIPLPAVRESLLTVTP